MTTLPFPLPTGCRYDGRAPLHKETRLYFTDTSTGGSFSIREQAATADLVQRKQRECRERFAAAAFGPPSI